MKKCMIAFIALFIGLSVHMQAQGNAAKAPENWFNLDWKSDGVPGVSSEKTYQTLLKGKKGVPVIVAVIDGGVDYNHEDLKSVMWKNPKEKADNSKDDDRNGYIDDIYGWSFIGNANGKNVHQDLLEVTRLYVHYDKLYKDKDASTLKGKAKKDYAYYKELEAVIQTEQQKAGATVGFYQSMKANYISSDSLLKTHFGKSEVTLEDLSTIDANNESLQSAAAVVGKLLENGMDVSYFDNVIEYFKGRAIYYDTTFDPRDIVGDDYANAYEWNYGSTDIAGPDAFHGTHVAGIIGADRKNTIGIKGVCDNARIMGVRVVPDGDERDKDVANGIRYAVDNGAKVINMSFGKSYSWNKQVVDEAIKYAEAHDVLLVHAAGNDGKNNDNTDNFPNKNFEKRPLFGRKQAKNWIEVGALNWQDGDRLAAPFSNYGKKNVDLFAPGMAINSTAPDNEYQDAQGTSMASPVAAGVAAMIRSYYPDLTAEQVRTILLKSVTKVERQVIKPGTKDEMVPFSSLSASGGIVNAYEAMQLAAKTKPGKKPKKPSTRTIDNTSGDAKAKSKSRV
ncbi:MAG: S8 family peptidase [Saprospiraceae bacterium]|nr:S8 family peptidase [Saprospiraceae bacterium]